MSSSNEQRLHELIRYYNARYETASADRQGFALSGSDQAESPLYLFVTQALTETLRGRRDLDGALADAEAKWRAYAEQNNRKVAEAPKYAGRDGIAGWSVIAHRWVDPDRFPEAARHVRSSLTHDSRKDTMTTPTQQPPPPQDAPRPPPRREAAPRARLVRPALRRRGVARGEEGGAGMRTFYSDHDPHACAWLRNLMAEGLIPEGHVDERDVRELAAADLAGYGHVALFAGIGGWSHALDLAGWDAARPVWTASCPCQPFSTAGKGEGEADERHLWPALLALVRDCRPDTLFGEQVASRAGYCWLDGVRTDLEQEGYAFGAADIPAAGVGAPHLRHRLFWMASLADADRDARLPCEPRLGDLSGNLPEETRRSKAPDRFAGGGDRSDGLVADADGRGRDGQGLRLPERGPRQAVPDAAEAGATGGMGDAGSGGRRRDSVRDAQGQEAVEPRLYADGSTARPAGFWDGYAIVPCADGKARRTQPGLQPLVDGLPFLLADGRTREGVSRSKALRGIGNAIVPAVAALFIRAFLEAEHDLHHH